MAEDTAAPDSTAQPDGSSQQDNTYDPMPPVKAGGEAFSFPGVFRDSADEDIADDKATGKDEKPAQEQTPAKAETDPTGEQKPKTEPTAEKRQPGIQADGKVVLGGREFRDINHANQAMSTVFGMFKAGQTKVTEAAERADHNLRAAQAWQTKYEELQAQIEKGAAPASKEAPTASREKAQDDAPEIDWELYEAIVEDHGLARAQRWLHNENLRVVEAQVAKQVGAVRGEVEQRFQPFAEQDAQIQHAREVQTLFQRVQTYTYPDGTKAYPELEYNDRGTDEEKQAQLATIAEIGNILREFVPAEMAVTDRGMHMAVLIYRDTQARTNAALKAFDPGATTTTPVIPANPSAAAVGDASAAPVVRPQGGPMRRDQQVIAEMDNAGKTVGKWGFTE
jgi:hypothetical protein